MVGSLEQKGLLETNTRVRLATDMHRQIRGHHSICQTKIMTPRQRTGRGRDGEWRSGKEWDGGKGEIVRGG